MKPTLFNCPKCNTLEMVILNDNKPHWMKCSFCNTGFVVRIKPKEKPKHDNGLNYERIIKGYETSKFRKCNQKYGYYTYLTKQK